MIFKGVREGKPYPEHGLSYKDWSRIPPQQIRLDELVTTTTVLALDRLLSEDSTFYGDLFPHAVRWKGITYLEDGLHRAVRAALRNRTVLHARVFDMDMPPVAVFFRPVICASLRLVKKKAILAPRPASRSETPLSRDMAVLLERGPDQECGPARSTPGDAQM